VLTILNANMANAIRSRTVQKGIDPRGFALVAMGGAGPLHGAEVAAMLGVTQVIVPPWPGITSAMGLLTTDLKYDAVRTQFQVSTAVDLDRINADFDSMTNGLAALFAADHIPPADVGYTRVGDLRYVGQGYELKVAFPADPVSTASMAQVFDTFHAAHAAEYGHAFPANPIEIVNLRVIGTGAMPHLQPLQAARGGPLAEAEIRRAPCMFRHQGRLQRYDTPSYARHLLPVATLFSGPTIILQKDTTTVVPPGWTATVHAAGSLILTKGDLA
jgi:N-methylhydantoinase A